MIIARAGFPPPSTFGLAPAVYPTWRASQELALAWSLGQTAAGVRIKGVCLPLGSGKSLYAAAYAMLTGKRTAILVGTRSLQTQYAEALSRHTDASIVVWADLRGQGNYRCVRDGGRVDTASCHIGVNCPLRQGGCAYFDRVREAGRADIAVINYACWLAVMGRVEGDDVRRDLWGRGFDLLVLDEGDTAMEQVGNYLAVEVSKRQLDQAGVVLPAEGTTLTDLRQWAGAVQPVVGKAGKSASGVRERLDMTRAARGLARLAGSTGEWVASWRGGTLMVQPVWPQDYREVLLRGVGDVIVMSATLTEVYMERVFHGRG